ncbi:uncharacterized protein BDR25DRAFT_86945 [Lindgomyces ingoldianus]|uniref:Uncharacterized protein n=1 Tax=Lindgomyces ingoldianus TaxID=673940 RepID=A0ACB6R903_9PLEO|nr:uncharacterized protein BDR25DRAFT_86945 [Lindgomyces ingoldianus]KAF2475631.1 hypothetical protein BDR25DRAFT_86945 [Lindgomyces ingoldianus]
MQLITILSAAALVATARASTSFNLNDSCIDTEPLARVHNRCSYPVHIWSVLKGQGCPSGEGAVLEPGQFYQENYRPAVNQAGTSIKISKTSQCSGVDITQLEYYIETSNPGYNYNYLDVSYVDCGGEKCPTRQEGFYLKSGNVDGKFLATGNNEICPILSCDSPSSCAKVAYIHPDDRQTKSCDPQANLDFYMCGGEAPGSESSQAPSSQYEAPGPSSTQTPAFTSAEVNAAAITESPKQEEHTLNIKTETVYVTEYAKVKRHAHGHRHQQFRA